MLRSLTIIPFVSRSNIIDLLPDDDETARCIIVVLAAMVMVGSPDNTIAYHVGLYSNIGRQIPCHDCMLTLLLMKKEIRRA